MAMSNVTAAFADAMETCAGYVAFTVIIARAFPYHPECRLKGPTYEQAARLQAAGGLHFLIGNHWHVLVRLLLL